MSPHNEIMAIQQKFSIPVACLVFALVGLALGMTVARDGKLAGFVVGIAVIFAYYIVMFLAESLAKGHYASRPNAARWVPNIAAGPVRRRRPDLARRHAEGRLPFGVKLRCRRCRPGCGAASRPATLRRARQTAAGRRGRAGQKGVVVVLRVPQLTSPLPSLIDRYISRMYLRVAGLSFLALLGLFYISTFIDKSDKIFKGQATPRRSVSCSST